LNGINSSSRPGLCIIKLLADQQTSTSHQTSAGTEPDQDNLFKVCFSVIDNGPGLSQLAYDELNTAHKMSSPSGAISLLPFHRIVAVHGGTIDVKTSPKGSNFSVKLELKIPDESTKSPTVIGKHREAACESFTKTVERRLRPPVQSISKSLLEASSSEKSVLSALVVDDVMANRLMTSKVLEIMGFDDIDEVDDGALAITACGNKAYTVVLMDNLMTNVNGKEATRAIRSSGYKGIIIGLTGYYEGDEFEAFGACGCDEVITKPLDTAELKRTLQSLGVKLPKRSSKK
jgi:CheY-like chemotaxis protein